MRKLMLHADRNGFYYVFDRTDGKLLLAKQFLKNVTWASGIGAGRPSRQASQSGTDGGRHARLPVAGRRHELVFALVQSAHRHVLFPDQRKVQHLYQARPAGVGGRTDVPWRFAAGERRSAAAAHSEGHRLPDRRDQMGDPAAGRRRSWGGTLSTATGLVFFEEETGSFVAADAATGKVLWSFQANTRIGMPRRWRISSTARSTLPSSPGGNIIAMALPE